MGTLPPIFRSGFLQAPDGDPVKKKALDEIVPIEHIMNWYKTRLSKTGIANRVLILKAETASGKSTAVPPYIFDQLIPKNVPNAPGIICTQPRVLTAIDNVREMLLWYPFLRAGDTVGWSTGFNKLKSNNYALLSATVDTLAAQLKSMKDDEICARYRFILIDETHERNLATDMTIATLKNFLLRNGNRPDCPFVTLMSATFEPDLFLDYFGVQLETNFIWVKGASYVINEQWKWNEDRDDRTVSDYARAIHDIVKKICVENWKRKENTDVQGKCDILVFMPGTAEIKYAMSHLHKLNLWLSQNNYPVFSLLKLDSIEIGENSLDYRRAMFISLTDYRIPLGDSWFLPFRRVIFATTVAETGLTLGDLKYVIDVGFSREVEYYPTLGVSGLITKPAQRPRIQQRRGRVGRKAYGEFFPLYPKYIWEKLPLATNAAIMIEDISKIMLDIIMEQLKSKHLSGDPDPSFDVADIDMLENPTGDAVNAAMEKLHLMGLISPYAPKFDYDAVTDLNIADNVPLKMTAPEERVPRMGITKMGLIARKFTSLTPENARMLLAAFMWEVSPLDIASIIAFVELGRPPVEVAQKNDDGTEPPPPSIDWNEVYMKGAPKYMMTTELFNKMRLIMSDSFIDGIILFNAIANAGMDTADELGIINLENWCSQAKLSFKNITLLFLAKREEIINTAMIAGINMLADYPSIIKCQPSECMDIIARMKHCIYDGYRANLLVRNGSEYFTMNGTRVKIPSLVDAPKNSGTPINEKVFPRYVVYRELGMKMNLRTNVYDIVAKNISVLDGFVSVDTDFIN